MISDPMKERYSSWHSFVKDLLDHSTPLFRSFYLFLMQFTAFVNDFLVLAYLFFLTGPGLPRLKQLNVKTYIFKLKIFYFLSKILYFNNFEVLSPSTDTHRGDLFVFLLQVLFRISP